MNKARRFLHRDSAPIISFSGFSAKKNEEKNRRVSDTVVPPYHAQPQCDRNQPKYYVKGINRDRAEEILNGQPIGTFLIRDRESATYSGCYTLSLRHKVGLKHHKIETHSASNKLIIAGHEHIQFDTLEELTEFFIKSQKKHVDLVPYDPDRVCHRMRSMTIDQPQYEDLDAPGNFDSDDMYLRMDEGCLDLEKHGQNLYRNGSSTPPIPSRKDFQQSYENFGEPKRGSLGRPQQRTPQKHIGYENLPEKGPPPSPSSSSAPQIPPRVPPSSGQGYENMPGKAHSLQQPGSYGNTPSRLSPKLPRDSYQNVPDRLSQSPTIPQRISYQNVQGRMSQVPPIPERHRSHGPGYENYSKTPTGYENYFSEGSRQSSSPQLGASQGHSYQNLPPKVAPRRAPTQTNYSAEQSLPPRVPVPIRRVKTDTERDFNARRM